MGPAWRGLFALGLIQRLSTGCAGRPVAGVGQQLQVKRSATVFGKRINQLGDGGEMDHRGAGFSAAKLAVKIPIVHACRQRSPTSSLLSRSGSTFTAGHSSCRAPGAHRHLKQSPCWGGVDFVRGGGGIGVPRRWPRLFLHPTLRAGGAFKSGVLPRLRNRRRFVGERRLRQG